MLSVGLVVTFPALSLDKHLETRYIAVFFSETSDLIKFMMVFAMTC